MKLRLACVLLGFLSLVFSMSAQTSGNSSASAQVPPLIQFSNVATDEGGNSLSGVVSITFSLYNGQQGGEPLWMETQSNIQLDATGHYSVQLGITQTNGVPTALFTSGEARWLGVRIAGQTEQPRVLLLSVPYALKAGDAATIGGLPPSAFVLAAPPLGAPVSAPLDVSTTQPASAPPPSGAVTGTGTVGFLPLWDSTSDIVSSALFQSGSGSTARIGINTTIPAASLDVEGSSYLNGAVALPASGQATAAKGRISQTLNLVASSFNSTTAAPVNQTFRWQAEPTGNNTSTPGGSLNLLYSSGTNRLAETGLNIAGNGQITFALGQKFPGTGDGTVTSVGSGAGLTGGTITTSGTLSIATGGVSNAMLVNPSLTVAAGTDLTGGGSVTLGGSTTLNLDTTKVPQLAGGNSFTGNQTVNGNLTVVNNSTYQPFLVQSSSTFGTWLELSNTSTGGHTWNVLSAGAGNAEGAGNLGITDLTGTSTIWLEGNLNAQGNVNVNNNGTLQIGTTSISGMLNAAATSSSLLAISATGFNAPSGSNLNGSNAINAMGGSGDPLSDTATAGVAGNFVGGGTGTTGTNPNYGITVSGGLGDPGSGTAGYFVGGSGRYYGGDGIDAYAGSGALNSGYAGYFNGDLDVTGAITAGTKDFKIDHPLDPANKYLFHASVESSEMMNIYTGNVITDAQGDARVELPDWFEAVNGDFRYQLTVIGQFAQAIVSSEVANHQFSIKTDKPNVKVSWQIAGVRQDAFAKAHPLIVEQEKGARERGHYIHPELYGASDPQSIDWALHPLRQRMQESARQLAASHQPAAPQKSK
jgi:hypothetical protein